MRVVVISKWYGRFGNNVIQVANALHCAEELRCHRVEFPSHSLFRGTRIQLKPPEEGEDDTRVIVREGELYFEDVSFRERRRVIQTYAPNLLKVPHPTRSFHIAAHVRAGDITGTPNMVPKTYVQPPLYYYRSFVGRTHSRCVVICEDKGPSNPVVRHLARDSRFKIFHRSIQEDLYVFLGARVIGFGMSTFAMIPIMFSKVLEKLVLPSFLREEYPADETWWGFPIEWIELPGYIKIGEWTNSKAQRSLMVHYAPPAQV